MMSLSRTSVDPSVKTDGRTTSFRPSRSDQAGRGRRAGQGGGTNRVTSLTEMRLCSCFSAIEEQMETAGLTVF